MTGGSCDTALQRARARIDTAGHACNTTGKGPRYGPARTTTRRYALDLGVVWAQGGPRVGALFTRISFDSVHCSESLFGTLFMSTIHEHCS